MNPLQKAIEATGGQSALAARMNDLLDLPNGKRIKQQDVWRWLNRAGAKVPGEVCVAIAKAANFCTTPHQLRPDIYPHPQDGLPPELREQAGAGE